MWKRYSSKLKNFERKLHNHKLHCEKTKLEIEYLQLEFEKNFDKQSIRFQILENIRVHLLTLKSQKGLVRYYSPIRTCFTILQFSFAETKWNHLLTILGKLIDHKDYSDEYLNNELGRRNVD